MRVALLAVALLVAGCFGGDGDGDDGDDGDDGTGFTSSPATTPPADPGAAPGPVSFAHAADECRELLVQIPVDEATADALVPDNYTLTGAGSGRALALAGLKMCTGVSIDGGAIGNASTSDVGIAVEAPDGSDGFHYYQLWWASDNPVLVVRLLQQGWTVAYTTNDTLTSDFAVATVGSAAFDVPLMGYGATADLAGGPLSPEVRAAGWHDGPLGSMRVDKTLAATAFAAGQGTLSTEAASLLRPLAGEASAGAALWSVYGLDATVGPP